uniref:Uncharacterized protein n=1 Tax=Vitis vinifera TaxID=29760 RepID=A5AD24_VITVI|nr:hypothetical protein VITISV_028315 [Vitis vinifera]
MSANKEAASSGSSEDARAEKSVDKLSVKEFRERFCIPNGVLLEFLDGEAVSTEKAEDNAITFTKEQFNAGLWFPLPSLFKEFLHFTQIPPAYIHPNIVRVLMRCSVLSLLFNLDLSLLEVLFVYSLKKGKNDIFSMAAHLPSLQLVTELPDSTKGGAKGHVLVRAAWAGLLGHPERPFSPNHSLELPGPDKRGRVVEWVEKASFTRLNKLFEVSAAERHHETLLTARNLRCKRQKLRNAEHSLTIERGGGKRELCGRLLAKNAAQPPFQELVIPPSTYVKEVTIRESENPVPPSISSCPGHLEFLNHSGPSMSMAGRLALLTEEATSINQSGSPHPDGDVAEASCAAALPPTTSPMEEMGAESQSLPPCGPNTLALVPGKGPARRRSRSGARPKVWPHKAASGSVLGNPRKNPPAPVVVPDGDSPGATQPTETDGAPNPEEESLSNASSGGNPVDDATCISVSAFSYAELEEKLKRIPPGSDVVIPSAKMFEVVETLVSGLRGMVQLHDLFSDLLRTADYMKAFVS